MFVNIGNMEKEHFELELILDEEELDGAACINQFKKVQEARTKLAVERVGFLVEVRKLLGYERFQELKTTVRERPMRQFNGQQGRKGSKERVLSGRE